MLVDTALCAGEETNGEEWINPICGEKVVLGNLFEIQDDVAKVEDARNISTSTQEVNLEGEREEGKEGCYCLDTKSKATEDTEKEDQSFFIGKHLCSTSVREQGQHFARSNLSQEIEINRWVDVLLSQQKRPLCQEECTTNSGVKISSFQGLTLTQYLLATKTLCQRKHIACTRCPVLIKAAETIIARIFVNLAEL